MGPNRYYLGFQLELYAVDPRAGYVCLENRSCCKAVSSDGRILYLYPFLLAYEIITLRIPSHKVYRTESSNMCICKPGT